jgi:hypothetical protein
MYDFGHPRTAKQYETAWSELHTALGTDDEAGLLLAVSGDHLLLDGTPLESAAAEKSFARMLGAAGIASIHFSPKVTHASLARFVRGFPTSSGSKPTQLAEQLKIALQGDPHIHVNEVCFVPADSAVAKSTVAAQLAARTLGMNPEQTDQLFNDPEKLLQLMVAAEGAKGGGLGPGAGPGPGGSGSGPVGRGGFGPTDVSGNDSGDGYGYYQGGSAATGNEGPVGSGSGPIVQGPIAPVSGAGAPGDESVSSSWNIVGGTGSGSPLDPNAGGFWLTKGDSATEQRTSGLSEPVPGVVSVADGQVSGGGSKTKPGGRPNSRSWNQPGVADDAVVGPASRWGQAPLGIRGGRSARGGPGSMAVETGLMTLQEDELQGILQVLAQIARTNDTSKEKLDPSTFQSRLSTLPRRARFTVSQALSALAAQAPSESADKPTLLKLAEHIAVRFALESYERGDTQVSAVRQMLDEMNSELDSLRKILGVYEEQMTKAGVHVHSHMEMLAQEFWSQVPEEKRKAVLESPDAWCVPPVRLREHIDALTARGETASVESVLTNYASCIKSENHEARRQTAMGLAELASLYARGEEKFFVNTIREVALQLAEERDSELQSLVGAAFVRLSQEATKERAYPAIQRSVEMLNYLDTERASISKNLRPRIDIENRLPEFIEEALRTGTVASGLKDLLRRLPQPAAEHVAGRFSRAGFREDCEILLSMMEALGPKGLEHLRAQLREGNQNEAIGTIGILARLDLETVERFLPDRMKGWKRTGHDRVVRQLAGSGSPERGRLLLQLFDSLDALIQPLAIDEIGMSGEKSTDMLLLRIAEGDLPKGATEYLRLKAIEALGRLRTAGAEAILRKVAEARKAWRWAHPSELRVVAAQALEKIDAEWMRSFIPRSGLSIADFSIELLDHDPSSSAVRQRRYPRLRLEHPVDATTTNLRENCRVDIAEMGLGGGVVLCEQSLHPGSLVDLRLNTSPKTVKAQTIVRDANTQARAFEVVDMDLEERSKLRKLLVQLGSAQKQSTSQERTRKGTRTIPTGGSS